MIKIVTYKDVNGLNFGSSEAEVFSVFGIPNSKNLNYEGELDFHYTEYIIRFEAGTRLFREFTLLPECEASVNDIQVEWQPTFLAKIQEKDSSLVEVFGFIISLKMGLAFSGFHDDNPSQRAIHAFRKGDWDVYQDQMKKFYINS